MAGEKPNVIIVTTDQQRCDSLSCYGSGFTSTPNIDRLSSDGVIFDRAYCSNPVCTPARASIFTGKYVSKHGAWNVGLNVPADEILLSHMLAGKGYRTHYVGKAHFNSFGAKFEESMEAHDRWDERYPEFSGPYYGFETVELSLGHTMWGIAGHYGAWVRSQVSGKEFESFKEAERLCEFSYGGEGYDWDLPMKYHSSVWSADRAVEFLEKHDGNKPFFLAVGFQDPHGSHAVPVEFSDRVDPEKTPSPDYDEGELDDKPPFFLEARQGKLEQSDVRGDYWVAGQGPGEDFTRVDNEQARLGRSYYYTMVKLIDREMGRILDCLDRKGLSENTIVVFTTDHGELLGDHGLWMKGPFHYECLVRIPMIVRWPKGFDGGRRTNALFSQTDIVPTLLACLGLDVPLNIDGVNGLPILKGQVEKIQESVLIECVDDPNKLRLKTIVTSNRKLTWYCGKPYGELYDLEQDPSEKKNLWDDAAYADEKSVLLSRILGHLDKIERRVRRDCYA